VAVEVSFNACGRGVAFVLGKRGWQKLGNSGVTIEQGKRRSIRGDPSPQS
jgi:hypothetical protein